MSHPVENIMRSTMEQLRQMVDVNTIVGSPVETGSGTVLLPVSKVSMGFVSGGGEYIMGQAATPVKRAGDALDASEGRYPFAGTAAGGHVPNAYGVRYKRKRAHAGIAGAV